MKKEILKKYWFPIALTAIFLVGAGLRFWSLATIQDKIFDEVYFPVFAQNYLTKTEFFDVHPPLGKLLIATGITLLGNDPIGWRIMGALAGLLLLLAMTGFAYDLTKRKSAALVVAFLYVIEPMALVESRVGLINIFLALFSILGLWFFWRWWNHPKHKTVDYILALLFLTAAISVKWIGAGALAAIVIFLLVQKFKYKKPIPFQPRNFVALLLIPFLYLATFIPDMLRGQDITWWHKNAFGYHLHLTATHPYGSEWWSWPLILRPIWLYYNLPQTKTVVGIIEIGNWLTWIGGLVTLFYVLYNAYFERFKKSSLNQPILFLTLTYLVLYLPWAFIGRVKFIYHYFVPLLVLLILLGIILEDRVLSKPKYRLYGYTFLILALAFFIYFLPLLIGYPISQSNYQQHMWLRSWI